MDKSINLDELELVHCLATPIETEVITVKVSTNQLSLGYVSALINRLCTDELGERILRTLPKVQKESYEKCPLNEKNLERYLKFLLEQRCLYIADKCTLWGRLRGLYIPSYWQFVLSMIGEVRVRARGIVIKPVAAESSDMDIEEAYCISRQLLEFEEVIHLHNAAMPRTKEGHTDVMTSALIADRVRSMTDSVHPALAYVVAIADMKLAEETKFAVLYRIQYDDFSNFVYQSSFRKVL